MRSHIVLFLLFLLSGCALPPLKDDLKTSRTDKLADYTKDQAATVYPEKEWWSLYGDPQLTWLIEEGIKQSPRMAEAAARIEKATALAELAGAPLFPQLTGQGYAQKYKQSYNMGFPAAFVPKGYRESARASLDFSYEIDFWGKNRSALKAAISEAQAAGLEAEQAKIILATTIARIYASFSELYAEWDNAQRSHVIRQKTVKLFEERHHNGLENLGSLEQAKANLAGVEAEIAALEENIDIARNQLTLAVGSTPDLVDKITRPQIDQIRPLTIPAPMPADLISRRPDLIAATLKLEALAKKVKVARAGFYPNINLAAYFGRQSLGFDNFFTSGSDIGAFGPALHLPLFKGGEIKARYKGAKADFHTALAAYEYTVGHALYEVAAAVASQKKLGLRIAKTREALTAAERAYQVIQDRYKGGLSNYIEVLAAEDKLIEGRRAMARILARAFTLDIDLIKALGGGFIPPDLAKETQCQTQ